MFGAKRKASQVFDKDDASHGRGPKYLKTDMEHTPSSKSPPLPGVVAKQVDINGTSVSLVPVPKDSRRTDTRQGGNVQAIVRGATSCFLQSPFPGFEFSQYIRSGMQGMARLINAVDQRLDYKKCANPPKYAILYRFFASIFSEMLSQRALYAGIIDSTTKRSFFSHIHHVHYSILVHSYRSLRNQRREKTSRRAELWAELDVDVLVDVVEAVVAAREAFLQNLAARRNAATTTQAKLQRHGQQHTEPGRPVRDEDPISIEIKDATRVKWETTKVKSETTRVKSETGPAASDMDDLGYKPEPEDDNIRLHDIPEYKEGNDGNGWLDDLDSEDEDDVPRPPSQGREYRAARKIAWQKLGEMRMRNAVDRWIRFTRAN